MINSQTHPSPDFITRQDFWGLTADGLEKWWCEWVGKTEKISLLYYVMSLPSSARVLGFSAVRKGSGQVKSAPNVDKKKNLFFFFFLDLQGDVMPWRSFMLFLCENADRNHLYFLSRSHRREWMFANDQSPGETRVGAQQQKLQSRGDDDGYVSERIPPRVKKSGIYTRMTTQSSPAGEMKTSGSLRRCGLKLEELIQRMTVRSVMFALTLIWFCGDL